MTTVSPEVIESKKKAFEEVYIMVNPSKKITRSPDGYYEQHAQQSWFWFNVGVNTVNFNQPIQV